MRDQETATLPGAQEPRWLRVDGGELPVWTTGAGGGSDGVAGRVVLMLHGISADHTEWSGVAARLAPDVACVLPDLLGRGASRPDPRAAFRVDEEVGRLECLMDALDLEAPLVAGHSHGATLALALARRRPTGGVLLASPVTPWTRRPAVLALLVSPLVRGAIEPVLRTCRVPLTRYILTRRVYAGRAPDLDDAIRRYAAPYADPARGRALLRVFRDWRPAEIAELAEPRGRPSAIRVITGSLDRRVRPDDARRWADRLGAPFEVVAGAGHGLTEEAPDRIVQVLRKMAAATNSNRETDEHQE